MSRDDAMGRPPAENGEEALRTIDEALRGLPPVRAPTATVQRTLERIKRARRRTPGHGVGWIMVAAASLVAVVGAWLSVRGGADSAHVTPADGLARYDVDAKAKGAQGRYRLRGLAEISENEKRAREETDESGLDASRDAGRGPLEQGFEPQDIPGGLIAPVTAAKPMAPEEDLDEDGERVSDKAGELAGTFAYDLVGDSKDAGVAPPERVDPSAVETNEEGARRTAIDGLALEETSAPASAEVTVDGKPWATVVAGTAEQTGKDAVARTRNDLKKIPLGRSSDASVNSPTPALVDRRVAAADQAQAAAPAPVTTTSTLEDGRHTVTVDEEGYNATTVVTRVPAATAGDTTLALATCDGVDDDCGGELAGVTGGVTGEGDLRDNLGDATKVTKADRAGAPAQDGANRRGELFWQVPAGGNDAWVDAGDAVAGPMLPPPDPGDAQRGKEEGRKLLSGLGGKRAVSARTLVPPAGATAGLASLPTQGYYANTYLPGDPETRWLRASLADRLTRDGVDLPLERGAKPPVQPFTAPAGQGLGLSLTADRLAVAGPTRMTVQIGLAGADRAASRRAPLNLALVLDVASVSGEAERRALWSLADALAVSRQPGDRFSIVVTGGAGDDGLLLSDAAMSGPEVRRALASAFETRSGAGDLDGAFARAVAEVRSGARTGATLGADMVVVASSRTVAADTRVRMEERARQAALSGVHVTAVGVGPRPDSAALRGLAEAGQGRRLLVSDSEGARAAMAKELSASGRAVARAVRLRIRLAEGVRLVGVLGSEPLADVESERVRAAEKAIDRQVRDATGIASDRGEDEDGIQIVIPAFYAGDRHVILLDLVAPGPGHVVDVRARFKDLVALGNGEASASLSLGAHPGAAPASPATRNVIANRAAYSIGEALLDASRALDAKDRAAASSALAGARAGLVELEAKDPALDAAFAADRAMLDQYVALLGDAAAWGGDPTLVGWVSRSLRLAARIKGLP